MSADESTPDSPEREPPLAETVAAPPPTLEDSVRTVLTPPPGGATKTADAPQATDRIGRYAILRELARGGMGVVYIARDTELGREVALKVMRSGAEASEQERERFQIEARAAARLRHPNIVGIHDVGEENGLLYFAMALVEGESLQRRIDRAGALEAREAARLTERLASALYYAHSQAILHRDMKPDNVLIDGAGEPLITDFGLAKDVDRKDEGVTKSGQMMGTPGYMPPEQAEGRLDQIDRRADVYSLGGTLYAMLTARPPFSGNSVMNTVTQVLTKEPARPRTIRPDVDRDLETICLKALEKEPERRYVSANDMALDLQRFLRNQPIHASPPTLVDRLRKWTRRNRGAARAVSVVVAAALLIGVGGTTLFVRRLQEETERATHSAQIAALRAVEARKQREIAETQRARAESSLAEVRLRIGDGQDEKARGAAERFAWREAAALLGASLGHEDRPERRGRLLAAVSKIPTARELSGHSSAVQALAFSPDGARLASADSGGSVRVWDTETVATVASFSIAQTRGRGVVWSPSGDRLACIVGKSVEVWSAAGARLATIEGHGVTVQVVAWSPDGQSLATGSRRPAVSVWDPASGERLKTFEEFRGRVGTLDWSPDSTQLACASNIGELRVATRTSPRAWTETTCAVPMRAEIYQVAFSPDGTALASAASDYMTRVWSPKTGEQVAALSGHALGVRAVAWTPDGNLLTGSLDGTGRLWTRSARSERRYALSATLAGHYSVERVAVAQSGARVATLGRERVQIWDRDGALHGEVPLRGPRVESPVVAWSPNGALLAAASKIEGDHSLQLWDTGGRPNLAVHPGDGSVGLARWLGSTRLLTRSRKLRIWRVDTGAPLALRDHPTERMDVSVSPRGERVVVRYGPLGELYEASGARLAELTGLQRGAEAVAFSPDGARMAVAARDASVRVYTRDGALLHVAEGHTRPVLGLAYSPDGTLLATASKDHTVRLWNAETGAPVCTLTGHANEVCRLAWSPNGQLLAALSWRGQLVLWDASSAAPIADVADAGRTLAWSPAGDRLATGSGIPTNTLRVFDSTGKPLASLSLPVERVAWSPDGARVAALGTAGVVVVWDGSSETASWTGKHALEMAWAPQGTILATSRNHKRRSGHSHTCREHTVLLIDGVRGRVVAELPGHRNKVRSLDWSPDGDWLASSSADGTARLWDARLALSPAALRRLATLRSQLEVDVLSLRPLAVEERR